MSQTDQIEGRFSDDVAERKTQLEAALKKESRMSRRQTLLKKIWRLNQRQQESASQTSD